MWGFSVPNPCIVPGSTIYRHISHLVFLLHDACNVIPTTDEETESEESHALITDSDNLVIQMCLTSKSGSFYYKALLQYIYICPEKSIYYQTNQKCNISHRIRNSPRVSKAFLVPTANDESTFYSNITMGSCGETTFHVGCQDTKATAESHTAASFPAPESLLKQLASPEDPL